MIQFIGFQRLKLLWLAAAGPGQTSLRPLAAFLLGALARAIAVCISFPFTRARTVLQSRAKAKKDDDDKSPPPIEGIVPLLRDLVGREGFFSLYQGFGPELMRGVGV